MIRILVIDDAATPDFLEGLAREVAGGFNSAVEHKHMNPAAAFKGGNEDQEIRQFLDQVAACGGEFWDIALIDLNLTDGERPDADHLTLSLSIAEAFRAQNRSAIVMLYSGTLAKHIPTLIEGDSSRKKSASEKTLKRIFQSSIAAFVPRDEMLQQVYAALEEPPTPLVADRLLTSHSGLTSQCAQSEFNGKSFSSLAASVRRQDSTGRRLTHLIVEYGVAAIVDLNA